MKRNTKPYSNTPPSKNPSNLPILRSSTTRKLSSANTLESKFNKNNMLVAVRCRPLNSRELEFSNINTVTISKREVVTVLNPLEYNYTNDSPMYLNNEKQMTITKTKEHQFAFDFAFGEVATQDEVYHYTTEMLLKNIVDGFNATVFAYGATGSGKTYTMVGNGQEPGLMIRSISDLFAEVEKEKGKNFNIQISYVEVYNETLKDLLSEDNATDVLDIRNDPNKGVVVVGAILKTVTNANDAFKLLIKGNNRRREEPTIHNENSSRSHAILQVHLEIKEQIEEKQNQITFGKFILVDLAGSEKITTQSKKSRESGSINKSLLALANCINTLVSQNKSFIPWRDSKLTRILKDSLGGNSQIVMIATISPSVMCVEETLYTLQYANRAKNLKIKLKKMIIEENVYIPKYEEVIKTLKTEINLIKVELAEKEKINTIITQPTIANGNNANEVNPMNENYQNEIVNHFKEEKRVMKDLIEKEKEIENIKNEINEIEFQIGNIGLNSNSNTNGLKQTISGKKEEIEKKKKEVANMYLQQTSLRKKRKELEKLIAKMVNANDLGAMKGNNNINNNAVGNVNATQNHNAIGKNLLQVYRYYIAKLEFLSSEHRTFCSRNEIERKNKTIEKLSKQLEYRDKFIISAGEEIQKAKGTFDFKNNKFQSAAEIEHMPFLLPIIKVVPDIEQRRAISPKKVLNRNIIEKEEEEGKNPVKRVSFDFPNEARKSPQPQKIITTYRQYNQELNTLLNKRYDNTKKMNQYRAFRRNLINVKSQYSLQGNKTINGNNIIRLKSANYNRYGKSNPQTNFQGNIRNNSDRNNTNNTSFSKSLDGSNQNDNHIMTLENEIQKKVKTILAKDYIGRYKRSPYI